MAKIRQRYPKSLKKIRIDRLAKITPLGKMSVAFINLLLKDPRIKRVQKQDDSGKLYPAVELHFKAYQELN